MMIEIQLQKKKIQMIKMAIEFGCHFDPFFKQDGLGFDPCSA
jgi:hypothetical protein